MKSIEQQKNLAILELVRAIYNANDTMGGFYFSPQEKQYCRIIESSSKKMPDLIMGMENKPLANDLQEKLREINKLAKDIKLDIITAEDIIEDITAWSVSNACEYLYRNKILPAREITEVVLKTINYTHILTGIERRISFLENKVLKLKQEEYRDNLNQSIEVHQILLKKYKELEPIYPRIKKSYKKMDCLISKNFSYAQEPDDLLHRLRQE